MPHSHLLLPPIPSLSDMATSFRWIRAKAQSLIKRIADRGFQVTTFGSLDRYFRECRDEGRFPRPRDIATVLFPHAAKKGVIYSIFGWDSAAPSGTMTTAGSA